MNMLDKIDLLMEERSINKSILAQESGIPKTTVYGWYKKGYENIRQTTLKKLADYFGVTMESLSNDSMGIEYAGPNNPIRAKEKSVTERSDGLSPERRAFVDRVMALDDAKFRWIDKIVTEVLHESGE